MLTGWWYNWYWLPLGHEQVIVVVCLGFVLLTVAVLERYIVSSPSAHWTSVGLLLPLLLVLFGICALPLLGAIVSSVAPQCKVLCFFHCGDFGVRCVKTQYWNARDLDQCYFLVWHRYTMMLLNVLTTGSPQGSPLSCLASSTGSSVLSVCGVGSSGRWSVLVR